MHLFYSLSTWMLLLVTSVGLIAAGLIGFVAGRIHQSRQPDAGSQLVAIQGSVLGLLALLLGFTFSVSLSRYETRRVLAIDEANALGTTFLRAQAPPEPYRTNLSKLLRRYIDLRLSTPGAIGNPAKEARILRQTDELQQAMWRQAVAVARRQPTPVVATFMLSMNESIDLFASRTTTYYARVPTAILWTLAFISVIGLALVGYGFGLADQRRIVLLATVSVLVAAVMAMIVDLDQPQSGPTHISQETMSDLRNSLSGYEAGSY